MNMTVLCPVRKNSVYLSHFLLDFWGSQNGNNALHIDLIVMLNKEDVWNKRLVKVWGDHPVFHTKFMCEDSGKGRFGLHEYYNEMAKTVPCVDWLMLVCEDFDFVMDDWDSFLLDMIINKGMDPQKINVILPRMKGSVGNV